MKEDTFCVQWHDKDVRHFDQLIANALAEKGLRVSRSMDADCPTDTPFVVSYLDHFSWDIRTYLSKLTIEITDAETTEILAYGESMQGSLGALGTSYQDVIDRAIAAMLGEVTE